MYRIVGVTPLQYIIRLRVNTACKLLEATDYSISQIAAIVGCEDPLYFSRLFRNQKGISPAEYRKQILKKALEENKD